MFASQTKFLIVFLTTIVFLASAFCGLGSNVSMAQRRADDLMAKINPNIRPKMKIDEARVEAAGIQIIRGQHLIVYTDIRDQPFVNELTDVFDQAVPLWCGYFGVDIEKTKHYRLAAFIMADENLFRKARLIPADLPKFPAGFNRGHETWIYKQKDAYYTRHLLIHEGTHAFMQWFGNGVGAPWYAEGMAELLAVHAWQDEKLSMNVRLTDRSQSEGWGRPKLINDQMAEGKFNSLTDVMQFPATAFSEVRSYAWAWAACEFFSNHKLTRDKFNTMQKSVDNQAEKFNQIFYHSIVADIDTLERDWRLFINEMDYGYVVDKGSIGELKMPVPGKPVYELLTDRSWQQVPALKVKSGDKFRVTAKGRFVIGQSQIEGDIKPWSCEANGITLEYFSGRPIGELQALILPAQLDSSSVMPTPISVGLNKVLTSPKDGVLCLRINESPAKLDDNKGSLEITIEKID